MTQTTRHRAALPALGLLLLASIAAPALAADLLVPDDFATIQSAVDAAADGDRILIAPGTYVEFVQVADKQLVIEGADGATSTQLTGDGSAGFLLSISGEAAGVELRGLTFTGGFGEAGSLGAGPGGAVSVDAATLIVRDSRFADNAGISGAAIRVVDGTLSVEDSLFENNQALQGGAVYLENATASIDSSEFTGNEATNFGGAIAVFNGTSFSLADAILTDNTANQFGGAVYAQHADLDLTGLLATDNGTAQQGEHGGWIISTFGGGALYATGSNGRLQDSRILGNVAFAGSGVYVAGDGELELVNNLIAGNGAACNCGQGAVYANASSPVLVNNTIAGNGGVFGVFTTYNAFPTLRNTIVAARPEGSEIFAPVGGNGLSDVDYTLLQGESGGVELGPNVIVVEGFPLIDPENDYSPLEGSAVIDAGRNEALPPDVTTDLLGNPRIVNATGIGEIVDLGAIEFGAAPMPDRISHKNFMAH